VLLSDSLGLYRPEVRQSLSIYDKPIVRLEAGSQKTYASLTGNKPAQYKNVVEGLSKVELERIIVQAKFVRGKADNSTDAELRSWLKQLGSVSPGQVQVYTLAKADSKTGLKPITPARLEAIANQVADKTGIPVEIVSA
jgi:wyosine [tRNA(Phe)-imidazoG37] synthetase (radical SAM superfamily)